MIASYVGCDQLPPIVIAISPEPTKDVCVLKSVVEGFVSKAYSNVMKSASSSNTLFPTNDAEPSDKPSMNALGSSWPAKPRLIIKLPN